MQRESGGQVRPRSGAAAERCCGAERWAIRGAGLCHRSNRGLEMWLKPSGQYGLTGCWTKHSSKLPQRSAAAGGGGACGNTHCQPGPCGWPGGRAPQRTGPSRRRAPPRSGGRAAAGRREGGASEYMAGRSPAAPQALPPHRWLPGAPDRGRAPPAAPARARSAHPGGGHAGGAEDGLGGDDSGHLGSLSDEGTARGAGGGPS